MAAVALDAGRIGWGASGRNGGFASMGYTTDVPVADSRNLLFYIRLLKGGRLQDMQDAGATCR